MNSVGMACKARALDFAAQGIYPVPQYSNCKSCVIPWKTEHTLDLDTIRAWEWEKAFGVAVIPGPSGLAIVDVDTHTPERNGLESLKRFEEEHGPLPPTYTEKTPGGGLHIVYRVPEGVDLKNFSGEIAPGLEIKAGKTLVTLAPSRRRGVPYVTIDDRDFAPLSESIEKAVREKQAAAEAEKAKARAARKQARKSGKKPRRAGGMDPKAKDLAWARAALEGVCTDVLEVGKGGRNTTLNNAALRMFRIVNGGAIPEEEVFEGLRDTGLAAGLQESEVLQTIESAKKAAQALPPIYRPDDWQPAFEPQIVERDGHQVRLPLGFFYRASDGALMHAEYDKEGNPTVPTYVCPHIEVVARAESADDWGTVFEFKDRRHKTSSI